MTTKTAEIIVYFYHLSHLVYKRYCNGTTDNNNSSEVIHYYMVHICIL